MMLTFQRVVNNTSIFCIDNELVVSVDRGETDRVVEHGKNIQMKKFFFFFSFSIFIGMYSI